MDQSIDFNVAIDLSSDEEDTQMADDDDVDLLEEQEDQLEALFRRFFQRANHFKSDQHRQQH